MEHLVEKIHDLQSQTRPQVSNLQPDRPLGCLSSLISTPRSTGTGGGISNATAYHTAESIHFITAFRPGLLTCEDICNAQSSFRTVSDEVHLQCIELSSLPKDASNMLRFSLKSSG